MTLQHSVEEPFLNEATLGNLAVEFRQFNNRRVHLRCHED